MYIKRLAALFISYLVLSQIQIHAIEDKNLDKSLIVFCADSLNKPANQMKVKFEKEHPGTEIILKIAGSIKCAREITELGSPCDVFISADYNVINDMLIPKYASWCIKFASNQIVIAYNEKSQYASEINSTNWYKILQQSGITWGHTNKNDDPCGYRALQTLKLAAIYYKDSDIYQNIIKNNCIQRPMDIELVSLLKQQKIDYIFVYKSVAIQDGLKYVELPKEINLGSADLKKYYSQVSVDIDGKKPGTEIIQKGEPMIYGLTIPNNAPNKETAIKFVKFVLSKNEGLEIMNKNGQPSVVPAQTETYDSLPDKLKKFATK